MRPSTTSVVNVGFPDDTVVGDFEFERTVPTIKKVWFYRSKRFHVPITEGYNHRNVCLVCYYCCRTCSHCCRSKRSMAFNVTSMAPGVPVTLLNFSAALDTIHHGIFLSRPKNPGIFPTPRKWLQTYLSGRTQRVAVKVRALSEVDITCGVPQGTLFHLHNISECLDRVNICHSTFT